MKLNLGCGIHKLDGYVNVDREEFTEPDMLLDLEQGPWPWAESSVTEIVASHVFEHLGETTARWMTLIKEVWRVCAPDAQLILTVPHPRHDNFLSDPTHVRPITVNSIAMFDQMRNIRDQEAGGGESQLGLYNGVDFEIIRAGYELTEPWRTDYINGRLSAEEVGRAIAERNNVCNEMRFEARVVKPPRGAAWLASRRRPRPASAPLAPLSITPL